MSKCEHGKQKSSCRDCGGSRFCEHGKRKDQCRDCDGSAFCEHGKYKSSCRDCGGSAFCEHGKYKSYCIDCGGSQICEHGKQKDRCRDCGGSRFCEHGKRKDQCRDCDGSAFCEHGKYKYSCRDCNGSRFCEHGKRKDQCRDCDGSAFCEHGKYKSSCRDCGGSQICEHGKYKSYCRDCGGSAFCEHGKYKSRCRDCGGSAFCEHGKQKDRCRDCGGSALCKNNWCETRGIKKYEGYCMPCFVNNPENHAKPAMRNYKTKEKDTVDNIIQTFPDFTWVADKQVRDGCSRRRPDLLLDLGSHIIIIEVDENRHNDYDCSCENKRLMELSQDLQHRPIVFIRFNPDEYVNKDGVSVKSCWGLNGLGVMGVKKSKRKEWEERIEVLKGQIGYWMGDIPDKMVEVVELFY